ncbi:hypothetical protein HMPREF9520_02989 [Enterococcus faecalis TX1467]|nr:hypothetical protein HMPREF9520_02989 [Enterococcus faecalis TX1467]
MDTKKKQGRAQLVHFTLVFSTVCCMMNKYTKPLTGKIITATK